MNSSLKTGLIGAGIAGVVLLGGQALLGGDEGFQTQTLKESNQTDTGYSTTRTNISTGKPDKDCGDFSTRVEAQDFFEAQGSGDPHGLDRDGDGEACETLP